MAVNVDSIGGNCREWHAGFRGKVGEPGLCDRIEGGIGVPGEAVGGSLINPVSTGLGTGDGSFARRQLILNSCSLVKGWVRALSWGAIT